MRVMKSGTTSAWLCGIALRSLAISVFTLTSIGAPACSDKCELSNGATDGYYVDGSAVKTISLYGHCKSDADKVTGKARFVPIWKEENVNVSAEGDRQVDIVFERKASTFLGETMANSEAAVLTLYKLDENITVTESTQIWGKLVPVNEGKTSARFSVKLGKGRYALENPYDDS
jgi:hypothetical protein